MKRHRGEADLSGRDVGLIGEHQERVSGYDSPMWAAVDKMVEGDYPTTNLGTLAAATKHGGHGGHTHTYKSGGSVEHEQRRMVEGERHRMRENMDKYAHAKKGGHMSHEKPSHHKKEHEAPRHHAHHMKEGGHPHHTKEMEYMEPHDKHTGSTMKKGGHTKHHSKHHYAAGGVGKVRKGQY
jgi:hypothetical protein